MGKEIKIIEAASENGAGKRGASLGPKAVLLEARQQHLKLFDNRIWEEVPNQNNALTPDYNTPHAKNIENLVVSLQAVCNQVEKTLRDDYFPLVISGDHSNAIGTVSGIKNFYSDEKIGVVWVDAHLDLHSPYTTPSGNIHGMALNALLDKDNLEHQKQDPAQLTEDLWEKLKRLGGHEICPKIQADQIVFIGTRDYEDEELSLVEKFGMKVFDPDDISRMGIELVLNETLEHLKNCDYIYVSFDVDSQDTTISEGTGTPVEGGLLYPEAIAVFRTLFQHPKVVAFEISEINPLLDCENKMAKAVIKLLQEVL